MKHKSLKIQQLDAKIGAIAKNITAFNKPAIGWLKAIRTAIGMSQQQLGNKLNITRQSVQEIESREKDGSITLNSLQETAAAMDMQLVYAFIPKDGSLEQLIERKARQIATEIVMRTSTSMKLEDQGNSRQRLKKAIDERTDYIKAEMPKTLWD